VIAKMNFADIAAELRQVDREIAALRSHGSGGNYFFHPAEKWVGIVIRRDAADVIAKAIIAAAIERRNELAAMAVKLVAAGELSPIVDGGAS